MYENWGTRIPVARVVALHIQGYKIKDFKKLTRKDNPGVIGIESQLSNKDIDKLVSEFIAGKDPEDYKGKAIKI